ncbi:MAG: DUF1868 domain-containing protein [Aggregatilineales bacterium]
MTTEIHYTHNVGIKFHPDGSPRQFPGNTIICSVNPSSTTFQLLTEMLDELRALPFVHKFALLPEPSLHMTVMELLCDEVRKRERWSSQLELDASLIETDDFFIETVPTVIAPGNFQMKYDYFYTSGTGIIIGIKPVDNQNMQRIRQYRDDVAAATGVRFADHDSYSFHISLAYRLIELRDDEATTLATLTERIGKKLESEFRVFDSGQPQLSFFDDMFAFLPIDKRLNLSSRRKNPGT